SVGGMPPSTRQELVGATLQALQPLLLHPEPLVWMHAARALGRLTGPLEQLEGMLLDWVQGDSVVLRRRAITAFASLPAHRFTYRRRWIAITAATDVIDGAERDPLDLELGLDNLARLAAQYDDEEADARAVRFAGMLAANFQEARRIALGTGRPRLRAAAINALEGSARALALRLWAPLVATPPGREP